MRRTGPFFFVALALLVCAAIYGASTPVANPRGGVVNQSQIGRGRFLSPGRSEGHQASIPFAIKWELDSATDIESQDLILSTDGGRTFTIKIAAHLPPEQRQLIWSAARGNVASSARLEVLL